MYYSKTSHPILLGMRILLLLAIVFLNFGPGGSGIAFAAPPSNNDFANATNIPGIPFNPTPYLVDEADVEAQEPEVPVLCDGHTLSVGFHTVWYQYTPGSNGSISMNTAGSNYDTYMAVWTGTWGSLNFVACDDDDAGGLTSRISFPVTAGTTYYIQIAEFNSWQGDPSGESQCPTYTTCTLDFNVAFFDAEVYIGDPLQEAYAITNYVLDSYKGVQGGPLFVKNPNTDPLVSSIRLLYRNSRTETYSELMGVPDSQLAGDYWLPLFIDDKVHDSQIRFTNTHETLSTTINIYLGNSLVHSQLLGPKEADRAPLTGLVGGPVRIESTTGGVNILAGMRIIYKNKSSFDEIMALPTALLDDEYWFPFYNHNNVNLFTEVRVGNPTNTATNVLIYIGDTLMGTYPLAGLNYLQKNFVGVQGGPLRVVSDDGTNLIASIRLLYRNSRTETLSELMGVPTSQLTTDYWLPYFVDNATHDSQIRFTNTHETLSTTVNIYLGNNPTPIHSQLLGPKEADRAPLTGLVGGPVRIESTTGGVNILAGQRIIYKNKSSFDEIMALPTALLDDAYWFPFYNHNNVNLFTEVRIGLPVIP